MAVLALALIAGITFLQPTLPLPLIENPEGLFELLLKTAKDQAPGWQLVVLVISGVLLVYGLRRFSGWLAKKWKPLSFLSFFATDIGGFILAVSGGMLEVMLLAAASGKAITGSVVWAGVKTAGMMILTYIGGKKTGLIKKSAATPPPLPLPDK